MATYSVPNGVASSSATLVASTADTVTFADRYGYVTVNNTGTTVLYARADGTAATIAGEGCYAVAPGDTAILANGLMLWYQSSKVIVNGTAPMESRAGQMANPGTSVSLISSGTPAYTVAAAG